MFELRFNRNEIRDWAERYNMRYDLLVEGQIAPRVRERQYYTRQEFLSLCQWKAPRPRRKVEDNSEEFVCQVTQTALRVSNERLRIMVLTLLSGVNWPTASVLLHFGHQEPYPIIDHRSLWALNTPVPKKFQFEFWWDYVEFCRELSSEVGVSIRTLNRALWQYSKENQKKEALKNIFMLGSGH